MGMNEVFGGC